MQIDRRAFLLTAAAAASCSRSDNSQPLRKAAQFLWEQQSTDGGFHSATYGLLRSGQSLTPFVLDALLDVPESVLARPAERVERALAFLKKDTNAEGSLGLMDPAADDYPNYSTALAVTCFTRVKLGNWQQTIAPMVAALRKQQFSEASGWKQGDPPFGAWGMGGPIHRPPNAGHVDLSMVRYVLEGLHAAGIPASDPAMTRALVYLQRSQNPDGGFYFSTVNLETNKAGEKDGRGTSYGTTTADGLLALRAVGLPESDDRVNRAAEWLQAHHQPDRAPGFDKTPYEAWATGLRFYYGGAICRAMPGLPVLLPPQRSDGSFRNSNNIVKEDDPLIATGFAVRVLASTAKA